MRSARFLGQRDVTEHRWGLRHRLWISFAVLRTRSGLCSMTPDSESYRALMPCFLDGFCALGSMPTALLPVTYPRSAGWRPTAQENPYNTSYFKASVRGAAHGRIARDRLLITEAGWCYQRVPAV
jgi:hypothetical protein